ncbi:MAG: TolC family protein [Spirosomataceae bacterium]
MRATTLLKTNLFDLTNILTKIIFQLSRSKVEQQMILVFLFLGCGMTSTWGQSKLSIQDALHLARENNPIIKASKLNINLAEADLTTAQLRPNPVLNNQTLQLVNRNYFAPNSEWLNTHNRQVWWQLTKPIVSPKVRQSKIQLGNRNVDLALKTHAEFERNFLVDVANKWLDCWFLQNRLSLLTRAQSNLDSLVNTNKIRFKNQVITETELIRTQLLLDQYQLQLKSIQQDYANEIQKLRFLMGGDLEPQLSEGGVIQPQVIPDNFEEFLQQTLSNRTDVKAIQAAIASNESNIQLQKALAKPRPELGVIWNPQNSVPYIGFYGTLPLPIFDRNQGNIKRAELEKAQNTQSFEATQLQIRTELWSAYHTYLLKKDNLSKFENILSQSEKVLNNVRFAYVKGGTTIIDYLDAQRSWFDTRQLYFETLLDFHRSYYQLLFVSGFITQL